jgi:carbon-monoxide dehydrogenase small subunit
MTEHDITLTVNGTEHDLTVESRTLLVHALRDDLGYTGPNVGCESTLCGACTVHLDGAAVKSCTVLAVQADGADVTTVEALEGNLCRCTGYQNIVNAVESAAGKMDAGAAGGD